jgi:hypothetical protein
VPFFTANFTFAFFNFCFGYKNESVNDVYDKGCSLFRDPYETLSEHYVELLMLNLLVRKVTNRLVLCSVDLVSRHSLCK